MCPLIKLESGLQLLRDAEDNICNWLDTKTTKAFMKQNQVALENVSINIAPVFQKKSKLTGRHEGAIYNVRMPILKLQFQFFSSASLVNGQHNSTMCLIGIMTDRCFMTILHLATDRLFQIQSEDAIGMAWFGF